MQVLCVGRHPFIAEHIARFFARSGLATVPVTGIEAARAAATALAPVAVLCEYDLLATQPIDGWERHPTLGRVPVLAVSLSRRPSEVNLLDVNGIAGFLYLPSLTPDDAARVLDGVRPPSGYVLPSPFGDLRAAATPRGW